MIGNEALAMAACAQRRGRLGLERVTSRCVSPQTWAALEHPVWRVTAVIAVEAAAAAAEDPSRVYQKEWFRCRSREGRARGRSLWLGGSLWQMTSQASAVLASLVSVTTEKTTRSAGGGGRDATDPCRCRRRGDARACR